MNRTRRTLTVAALALAAALPAAQAQDKWPSKPITYIVAFPAGGTSDIVARLIAQKLGPALGTTVIVDNKAGAGGGVGSEQVSRAAPDGYTLLGGTISSHAINVSLYPKLGYDPVTSFVPIALIGTNPVVLVTRQDSPYKTVADVIAAGKAKKPMTSASAGNGTSQHLALEMLKHKTGIGIDHIPYKGSAPAIQDVMAGQVDMMFDTTVVAGPHIESGKLRALAVTSAKRLPNMPNVPTVAETVPGYEVVSWQAIFAPAGTPKAIQQRLHDEVNKILAQPDIKERLAKLGMEPGQLSTDQFTAFQKAEVAKWAQLIKAANIKIE
ncbi:Bug family tripartite tricarboxylate transporter substrate binding protein [Azohydromonas caseinilytica]|uniref:Tripartite tricarboxylate transporter substrate binding protein n=1 Tax=Azohydromonas caseinilytica TaxID=2728836 RepID=A0A848FEJ2_9BURK|nr:tripartite tricarboxylate transporter substrate binding protein [Azohydromonas caseinilytica]NML17712.1 tripartite tricarboxylate transporter substrate binding protein [Azohydromonas caseinilytica]